MIEWLNSNQGFVMCLLTLIYVLATIIIVKKNSDSIKEMRISREAENRPYVLATLNKDPRDVCFYLCLKNYGKSGSIIKSIIIKPKLELVETELGDTILNNSILAPNQAIRFIVLEEWKKTCEVTYNIEITYSSMDKRSEYYEQYSLVTQYAHQMGYTDGIKDDATKCLASIAEHLDSIRNKI